MRPVFLLSCIFIAAFTSTVTHAQLSKEQKKIEKIYIKYKDTVRLAELYLENGRVSEGHRSFKE